MRLVCRIGKIGLVLCLLPLLTGAAVYRWVDESGVVNYTQIKPEGVNAERVSADTGQRIGGDATPAAATPEQPADPQEQQLTEAQQQMLADLKAAEAERQRQISKVREANCQQARTMLDRLTATGRVRVVGEDGVERVMPEDERQQRIDESQRAVAANCAETASR